MVRMLVTRPEPDASETAGKLSALGIEVVVEPLLHYDLLQTSLPDPAGFTAILLTSSNSLRALSDRGAIETYRHLKAYAVGDRTADIARSLGFADVVSARGSLDDLVGLVVAQGAAGPVFYPASRERAGNLGKALARHGIMVITTEIYGMTQATALSPPVRSTIEAGQLNAALFFSRRTAETFAELSADISARDRLSMLCISEAVAAPLLKSHFGRVSLADYPSEEAMLGLALSFVRGQKQGMIGQ
jgi:uroporphyrinogen-III synthase